MVKSLLTPIKAKLESNFSYKSFHKPIFIISPPRSGSTFLFECLTQFDNLYYLNHESDNIWWANFPYETMKYPSDYIDVEEVSYAQIKSLRRQFYQAVASNYRRRNPHQPRLPYWFGMKRIRSLDKTIANCFRIDLLESIFPDAQYIFLTRDPRANISSMIEGWPYVNRYGKPQLTPIIRTLKESTVDHWTFPAPPGWQNIVSQPLPEICAWSWQQHIEYALHFFEQSSKKPIVIRYEDLVDDTFQTIFNLGQELELVSSQKVSEHAETSPLSRTTFSKPYPNKWKEKNYQNIASILPQIEGTAQKIGYDVLSDLYAK